MNKCFSSDICVQMERIRKVSTSPGTHAYLAGLGTLLQRLAEHVLLEVDGGVGLHDVSLDGLHGRAGAVLQGHDGLLGHFKIGLGSGHCRKCCMLEDEGGDWIDSWNEVRAVFSESTKGFNHIKNCRTFKEIGNIKCPARLHPDKYTAKHVHCVPFGVEIVASFSVCFLFFDLMAYQARLFVLFFVVGGNCF